VATHHFLLARPYTTPIVEATVPTMGPNTDFKPWKRNFLTFLSMKATYLIPQLAIREAGVWLDEAT
jgi:hypothetical protein